MTVSSVRQHAHVVACLGVGKKANRRKSVRTLRERHVLATEEVAPMQGDKQEELCLPRRVAKGSSARRRSASVIIGEACLSSARRTVCHRVSLATDRRPAGTRPSPFPDLTPVIVLGDALEIDRAHGAVSLFDLEPNIREHESAIVEVESLDGGDCLTNVRTGVLVVVPLVQRPIGAGF